MLRFMLKQATSWKIVGAMLALDKNGYDLR